ncbi:MAG: YebC/PmpR family DNA-binding transcriptional regulator [Bacteroidales bacterium]|nr:YebC/PmpR family DNA-binding transcriptional regulator [Bacteroidales bacterium]MBS3774238.1 YebC/PmpR family DNA-binding transcriptional regulator [Bacteroidales bacterium]
MAGHSKWANIKRRKEAQDAKKAKIFSRIIKEISVAVKEGGNDPESNSRLRMAIQNAKGVNMPKENIERAIKKASGDGNQLEKVYFEGYAQGGVAIFVECLTDNRNRTVSSIRSIFTKNGGSLGKNGSISYLFDQKGIFTIPRKEDMDLEELELELIDAGAEDLEVEDDFLTVTTAKEDFGGVQKKLEELNIEPDNASLQQIPKARKALDLESSLKVMKMVDAFEEDDDVQNVYHNLELTDELQEALNNQ